LETLEPPQLLLQLLDLLFQAIRLGLMASQLLSVGGVGSHELRKAAAPQLKKKRGNRP
jgi:hypothetical protein